MGNIKKLRGAIDDVIERHDDITDTRDLPEIVAEVAKEHGVEFDDLQRSVQDFLVGV